MVEPVHHGTCPGCHHSLNEHLKVRSPETDIQALGESDGDSEFVCLHHSYTFTVPIICDCVLVFRLPQVAA